jgi:hypothetical protein
MADTPFNDVDDWYLLGLQGISAIMGVPNTGKNFGEQMVVHSDPERQTLRIAHQQDKTCIYIRGPKP